MRFMKQHPAVCLLFSLLFTERLVTAPAELPNVSDQNSRQPATGDLNAGIPNTVNGTAGDYHEVGNDSYDNKTDDHNPDGSEVHSRHSLQSMAERKYGLTGSLIAIFSVSISLLICCTIFLRCAHSCFRACNPAPREIDTLQRCGSTPEYIPSMYTTLESYARGPLNIHHATPSFLRRAYSDLPYNPSYFDSIFDVNRTAAFRPNGGVGHQLFSEAAPSLVTARTARSEVPRPSREEHRQRLFEEEDIGNESAAASSTTPPRQDKHCKICDDNPQNAVLIPCGHGNMCMECVNKTSTCPYCRVKITGRLRVFLDD